MRGCDVGIPVCSRGTVLCLRAANGMPFEGYSMLTSKRFRKTKDGMCRRIAAHLDAHHRRIKERRSHDTPREVSCSSFAFILKGGGFQVANSYRVSIVAKLPRNGAGKSEVKVEGEGEQWNWKS